MAGVYTQKRNLSNPIHISGKDSSGYAFAIPAGSAESVGFEDQVTTSYRSGGRFNSQGDSGDLSELISSSRDRFNRPYDTGHEFNTIRRKLIHSHNEVFLTGPNNSFFRGPLVLNRPDVGFVTPSTIDLNYYGTKAISLTRPDKPRSQTLTSLIELSKEGIPSMIGFVNSRQFGANHSTRNVLNKSGSEWLNYEFGIKPLITAIQQTATAVLQADAILEQYMRDSAKIVRRQLEFPSLINTTSTTPSGGVTVNGYLNDHTRWKNSFTPGFTSNVVVQDVREDIWFSGAYQYYLENHLSDPFSDLELFRKKAKILLNLELTPEVIYNITPWSWLLDWFFNFGDILANADSFNQNGVLLRYGYVMRRTTIHKTVTIPELTFYGGKTFRGVSSTYLTVQKSRIKATPFGFGLNPNSFTNGQWTILAALGMTKGANKLR